MKPTDFSVHVTSFLTHYLAAQRNVSPNTIKAYRDVFTLLLRFCRDVQGIAPERLRLEQMDVSRVETFLDYLEQEKKALQHNLWVSPRLDAQLKERDVKEAASTGERRNKRG